MKKIYSLIVLLMLCFVGTAHAQRGWELGAQTTESQLAGIADDAHYFVLAAGTSTEGKYQSILGHYLSVGESKLAPGSAPTTPSVYQILKQEQQHNGYPVYALKSVENNKYLAKSNGYAQSVTDAFKFTVRTAQAFPENGEANANTWKWEDYSHAVSDSRAAEAANLGNLVLCSIEGATYIHFEGNPSLNGWMDANNWVIYQVNEVELTNYQKFQEVFAKYFTGVSSDNVAVMFPGGVNPGTATAEASAAVQRVFNEASALNNIAESKPENDPYFQEVIDKIITVMADYKTQVNPVVEGYYMLVNMRGATKPSMAYVEGDKVKLEDSEPAITAYTPEAANYIWQVEKSKTEGKFFFKNWGANQYLRTPNKGENVYRVGDEKKDLVTPDHEEADKFRLNVSGTWMHHQASDHHCVTWNDKSDGSMWRFVVVPADSVSKLAPMVEQKVMNDKLGELLKKANNKLVNLRYKNGFINDGHYNYPADSGLVKTFTSNAESKKWSNGAEAVFDGSMDNGKCFHTSTDKNDVIKEGPNHWIEMDLGKELDSVVIKFTRRSGNKNSHISRYELRAEYNGKWETIANSEDSIVYQFQYGVAKDSVDTLFQHPATHIAAYKLAKPAQKVRFVVTKTMRRAEMAGETGPTWHMAEFRIYDGKETVENPKFAAVPEESKAALNEAIKVAQSAFDEGKATKELIKLLDGAIKKFDEGYPDVDPLKTAVEEAELLVQEAGKKERGDGSLGSFPAGATKDLAALVEQLKPIVNNPETLLSVAQIKAYQKQLQEVVDALNAMMITPAPGFYQIVSERKEGQTNVSNAWGSYIYSANVDTASVLRWGYVGDVNASMLLSTIWKLEKDEAGYSLQNVATGLYMNNPFEGFTEEKELDSIAEVRFVKGSPVKKHFNFAMATKVSEASTAFQIALAPSRFLNAETEGAKKDNIVVHYNEQNDQNGMFTFQEVDENLWWEEAALKVNVTPGATQIITLPYATEEFFNDTYKVKGLFENKLYLEPYFTEAGGENLIPAGTPFIVVAPKNVTALEGYPSIAYESFADVEHVSDVKVVNGLVSAPKAFSVAAGEGFGVLVDNIITVPVEKTVVAAGTGMFNNEVPVLSAAPADAPYIIVEGEIKGEGTAVEEIEVVKNVASDVYTLSGVKVRHNVKAADATVGLPKGIYIVGGKKVVVK